MILGRYQGLKAVLNARTAAALVDRVAAADELADRIAIPAVGINRRTQIKLTPSRDQQPPK
ncbi:hypothetical protein [Sphingomonas sp. UYP23]